MLDKRPVGRPYSQVYLERGPASDDSATMRRRLGAYLAEQPYNHREAIARHLRQETGASVQTHTFRAYFSDCTVPALLDSIYHVYVALKFGSTRSSMGTAWLRFVARTLTEENVSYVVDVEGGVHPAVDKEFDIARRATLAQLDQPRYSAALRAFDDGMACLKEPRNSRDAVRGVFDALETVVKLMFTNVSRLGAKEIEKFLKPLALSI